MYWRLASEVIYVNTAQVVSFLFPIRYPNWSIQGIPDMQRKKVFFNYQFQPWQDTLISQGLYEAVSLGATNIRHQFTIIRQFLRQYLGEEEEGGSI